MSCSPHEAGFHASPFDTDGRHFLVGICVWSLIPVVNIPEVKKLSYIEKCA